MATAAHLNVLHLTIKISPRHELGQLNPGAHLSSVHGDIPVETHAQLSLTDYVDSYFQDPFTQN
jgi:hypothetical protein